MRRGFFVSSLLVSLVVGSACSLVIGDVPDNVPGAGGSGGGGHAGDGVASGSGGAIDGGAGAANAGTGGSAAIDGSGVGGSGCTSNCGTAGGGGVSSGGAAGRGGGGASNGGANSGGAGRGDGSPGDAKLVDAQRDVSTGSAGNGGAGNGGAGTGATGGGGATSGGAGKGGAGSGGTPDASTPDPCDVDMDGHRSRTCPGGDDCDDNAFLVHPGQMVYFEDPTHPGGTEFDYDCSGQSEPDPQYKAVDCANLLGLACDQSGSGFLGTTTPPCGQAAPFGHCVKPLLTCVEQVDQQSKKMPCR